MKLNEYGVASRRPLIAAVPASMVTSYFVASGSRLAGVKIRIVVPDHLKVPAAAGVMWKNAGFSFGGTVANETIGSENTTRISLPSSPAWISPVGPALTMRSGVRG